MAEAPKSGKRRSAEATAQRDDRAFAEFEALTRKLVRVPKSEIDAERAKTNGVDEVARQRARDRAGDDPPPRGAGAAKK